MTHQNQSMTSVLVVDHRTQRCCARDAIHHGHVLLGNVLVVDHHLLITDTPDLAQITVRVDEDVAEGLVLVELAAAGEHLLSARGTALDIAAEVVESARGDSTIAATLVG